MDIFCEDCSFVGCVLLGQVCDAGGAGPLQRGLLQLPAALARAASAGRLSTPACPLTQQLALQAQETRSSPRGMTDLQSDSRL